MTKSQKQERVDELKKQNESIAKANDWISRPESFTLGTDDEWVKKKVEKFLAALRRRQEKNKIRIAEL